MNVDADWWRSFFGEDYLFIADRVAPEVGERMVDFVVERLQLDSSSRVLDVACGHGRHTLELARRGITVVGLDYSEPSLAAARAAADAEGLDVDLVRADMRQVPFADGSFTAAINLWTAFGYFADETDDAGVIAEVVRVLTPGGRFLLDTISAPGLFPRWRDHRWEPLADGAVLLQEHSYDPVRGRDDARWTLIRADGTRRQLDHSVRLYMLHELVAMLASAGLRFESAFGDFDGAEYHRESRRMIVLAAKEGSATVE